MFWGTIWAHAVVCVTLFTRDPLVRKECGWRRETGGGGLIETGEGGLIETGGGGLIETRGGLIETGGGGLTETGGGGLMETARDDINLACSKKLYNECNIF